MGRPTCRAPELWCGTPLIGLKIEFDADHLDGLEIQLPPYPRNRT